MDDYKTILEDAMRLLQEWDRQHREATASQVLNPDLVELMQRIRILEGQEA